MFCFELNLLLSHTTTLVLTNKSVKFKKIWTMSKSKHWSRSKNLSINLTSFLSFKKKVKTLANLYLQYISISIFLIVNVKVFYHLKVNPERSLHEYIYFSHYNDQRKIQVLKDKTLEFQLKLKKHQMLSFKISIYYGNRNSSKVI